MCNGYTEGKSSSRECQNVPNNAMRLDAENSRQLQVEGISGQPDFQPSGPPISVQKGLP